LSHNQTRIAYFFFSFFLALVHTLTTRFFDRMRGVDSALQFAVSYHNFVYFFCRQFMLNPDIIPELVVSGIFIIVLMGGHLGGVRHLSFAQFGLHVLQLALTTAHGFLVGIHSYT